MTLRDVLNLLDQRIEETEGYAKKMGLYPYYVCMDHKQAYEVRECLRACEKQLQGFEGA